VLSPQGNIYAIPYASEYVLRIDPAHDGTTSLVGSNLGSANGKWSFGALSPQGNIYATPLNSEFVLRIDPVSGL
jgi:streptogramin lyase